MAGSIILSGIDVSESWMQGDDSLQMLLLDGELCRICPDTGATDFEKTAD